MFLKLTCVNKNKNKKRINISPEWTPFCDWSVHQGVPSWSWGTNLGPFETLGSPLRTLTRPLGDPAGPQKQAQALRNIATFEISHFCSIHTQLTCVNSTKILNFESRHILNGLGPFCRLVCPPMGLELVLEDELGTFRVHIHTRTRRNTHTHMRAHIHTHYLHTLTRTGTCRILSSA